MEENYAVSFQSILFLSEKKLKLISEFVFQKRSKQGLVWCGEEEDPPMNKWNFVRFSVANSYFGTKSLSDLVVRKEGLWAEKLKF